MALIGYARTSTSDQDASLQIDALKREGCELLFTDTASGSKADRPELTKMIEQLRKGDTVVLWRLDRLGRSLKNLLELVAVFDEKGVGFRSIKDNIDTSSANGRLFFSIMGALAQFEKELLVERTNAGLAAARARGRVGGRPKALDDKGIAAARKLYRSGDHTVPEIATLLGVSPATVYRNLDSTLKSA